MSLLAQIAPNLTAPGVVVRRAYKVGFMSHTSGLGGAERALLEIVDGLQRAGLDCVVFLPMQGPLATAFAKVGVRCVIVGYSWWSNPVHKIRRNLNNLAAAARLALIFRREKLDLIYSNTMMIPSGAIAAKFCGLPHIWHIHEFGPDDHGLHFDIGDRLGRRLIGLLSTKVLCVSNAVGANLAGSVPGRKLSTVYGAVVVPEMAPSLDEVGTPSVVHCVLVGVLRPSKGPKEAIQAIGILVKSGLDVSLSLVGSGPMEEELRDFVRRERLSDHVTFTGFVDKPYPIMQQADIVLNCSQCEAFGRPVLEGMMLGKPIVGSRSGGTTEAVRDGINGLLYTPGDAQDLAAKIRLLAEDLAYARRLGANGYEWSRRSFTIDVLIERVFQHIETALRGDPIGLKSS